MCYPLLSVCSLLSGGPDSSDNYGSVLDVPLVCSVVCSCDYSSCTWKVFPPLETKLQFKGQILNLFIPSWTKDQKLHPTWWILRSNVNPFLPRNCVKLSQWCCLLIGSWKGCIVIEDLNIGLCLKEWISPLISNSCNYSVLLTNDDKKTPNSSPQRSILVSHRKVWRQFAVIQFARIFSSKMNPGARGGRTKTYCTKTVYEHLYVCSQIESASRISCFQKLLNVILCHVFYSMFW